MWPLLLDMTKEESIKNLRNLELEAYSHLISALRAQGPLNPDKRKLLKDTGHVLNISNDRHKAEVRRAISDEKLNTIAYHITGHTESLENWAQEGRRLVPLLPRSAPQTAYSALADEASEAACQSNKLLPAPANTERKRPSSVSLPPTNSASESSKASFRVPDPPKVDDKKRKLQHSQENSNMTQHLLSPKVCRIQQLYRQQRSRSKPKESHKKTDQDHIDNVSSHRIMMPPNQPQAVVCSPAQPQYVNQKVNVLQNFAFQPIKEESTTMEEYTEYKNKTSDPTVTQPTGSNENQAPRPKLVTNIKPNMNITIKQQSLPSAGPSSELQKSLKLCSGKKSITKTVSSGQKLIVVSNAQTLPSNSILQRTLQIPFVKNVSIKNFEKFKIVTSSSTPSSIQVTSVSNSPLNSVKHKVVTVKTNPNSKKVIPLSQLQVLNSKGSIKVLPLGGKIVGKTVTASSPLYIMNSTKSTSSTQVISTSKVQEVVEVQPKPEIIIESSGVNTEVPNNDHEKSSVLEDILKASGVISEATEDYDAKITEFHIPHIQTQNGLTDSAEVLSNVSHNNEIGQHIQEFDYTILPMDPIDENNMKEIEQGAFHHEHMEIAETEIIEEETTLLNEEGDSHIACEEVPQLVYQVECSKMTDTDEHN